MYAAVLTDGMNRETVKLAMLIDIVDGRTKRSLGRWGKGTAHFHMQCMGHIQGALTDVVNNVGVS